MVSTLLTVRSGHTAGCVYGGGNVIRYEDVWGSGGIAALILDLSAKFSEWSVFCYGRFTRERDHPVPVE